MHKKDWAACGVRWWMCNRKSHWRCERQWLGGSVNMSSRGALLDGYMTDSASADTSSFWAGNSQPSPNRIPYRPIQPAMITDLLAETPDKVADTKQIAVISPIIQNILLRLINHTIFTILLIRRCRFGLY